MIEAVHYKCRDGTQMVGVTGGQYGLFFDCPDGKVYAQRYAAGLEPAFYPVPAVIYHIYLPSETEYGSIWEHTRFDCEPYGVTFNKRVHVFPPPPMDPAVQLAVSLIVDFFKDGSKA